MGNWITVNGDGAWSRESLQFERLRLRLVNAANARIFTLELNRMEGWVVALDGQPLPVPTAAGALVLSPGERADLIVGRGRGARGRRAFLVTRDREDSHTLATFPVRSHRAARPGCPPRRRCRPILSRRSETLATARHETLRMDGGAMGRMRQAMLGGRVLGVQDLAEQGKVWAFNGLAEMPDEPLLTASLGETVRLTMVNDTSWPHAMHLHGHHFRAVAPDGSAGPPARYLADEPWRDDRRRVRRGQPGRLAAALPHARALGRGNEDLVPSVMNGRTCAGFDVRGVFRVIGPRSRAGMVRLAGVAGLAAAVVVAGVAWYVGRGHRWAGRGCLGPRSGSPGRSGVRAALRRLPWQGARRRADWRRRKADGTLPAPPHDATGHTWHHSDELLFRLTRDGPGVIAGEDYRTTMPAYGGILSDREIWSVLAYIKSRWPAEIQMVQAER